jgi:hypothetical protein
LFSIDNEDKVIPANMTEKSLEMAHVCCANRYSTGVTQPYAYHLHLTVLLS